VNKLAILLSIPLFLLAADFKTGLDAYNRGDFATALKEWLPIAGQGDPNAQYNVALLYAHGQGAPQDWQKAKDWYLKAAGQGVAAAQYNLGVMYANGEGVPKDPAEAEKWFTKAAQQGIGAAQATLGRMYSEGGAAFPNYAEAEKWYRKAAEQGDAAAAFELGVMYDIGQGVKQDVKEALKWYHTAADAGYAAAFTNIGVLYYNGEGVKHDLVQSYAWLERGWKLGDPRALELISWVGGNMKAAEIRKAQQIVAEWQPPKPQQQAADAKWFKQPESAAAAGAAATASTSARQPAETAAATEPPPAASAPTAAPVPIHQPAPAPAAPARAPAPAVAAANGPASAAPSSPTHAGAGTPPAPRRPAPTIVTAKTTPPPKRNSQIQDVWTGVDRVVAVGDIHGDYEQFVLVLESAGLIDGDGNWIGGKSHLVQMGDVVDRGPDSRAIMDLLMRLEKQAAAAGGGVHCLIGNHEAMDAYGDLYYVSQGEFAAFAPNSADRSASYTEGSVTAPAKPDLGRTGNAGPHPPGYDALKAAFGPNGKYGRWIRSHNAVIKIDRTLFMHAGLGPKYADWPVDAINDEVRAELNDPARLHGGIVADEEGPLWYRGLAEGDEGQMRPLVDRLLQNFDVDRIVVGHTFTGGAVMPRFGGRLVMVDVGLSRAYDNTARLACLEIVNGQAYAIHRGQKLALPSDENGPDMLRYLREAAALDPQPSPLLPEIENLERK
jgi:TPR repeat protein